MNTPTELRYTPSHQWARLEADGSVAVGITDYAQQSLGDLMFVENPAVGRKLSADEECAIVESAKTASDVFSPIAGLVIATNTAVEKTPELINKDAYGAWMFKIKPDDAAALNSLMDAAAYQALVEIEA
ncbi:MAG: glycine cleavage system protein GcvH [Burkholderiales bacterium]